MNDLILCTKCKKYKPKSDFWFDKRRNKHRRPCISCSNLKESLTVKLRYANDIVTHSDIVNHYKGKGFSDEMCSFFSDLIILNRTIKKMSKPTIKQDADKIYLFCPNCRAIEHVNLPCQASLMADILNTFTAIHTHDEV